MLKMEKGKKGMNCWEFSMIRMKKTLGKLHGLQSGWMLKLGPGETTCHKTLKMLVLGPKKRVVAKLEHLDKLEKCLGWMHQRISGSLQDLLDVVPTTKSLGEICGADIQWLQGEKLEIHLLSVRDAQNKRVVKMCGLQTDDVTAKDSGEVLQTTTVPLNEVRGELGEWKDAMLKEYNSLVHETKAIEPVDLSSLNQEAVEFVPGKLVTVRKKRVQMGEKRNVEG